MILISRERAFERAKRLKEMNERIYGVEFEMTMQYLSLDILVPTQWELNEVKLLVVLQEIKHGYDAPPIILEYRGKYYILDGHHRAYALWKLGFSQAECIILRPKGDVEMKIEESVEKMKLKSLDDIRIVRG